MSRASFALVLLVSVAAVALGSADIALAGPGNSNGCTTKLWIPSVGTPGILCGTTSCTTTCTSVQVPGTTNIWICGCPSNPAQDLAAYIANNVCVTAVRVFKHGTLNLKCYQSGCPNPCDIESSTEPDGIEQWCECPF